MDAAVVNFEVYLLMTMKPRLSLADVQGLLDEKLTEVGLSLHDAASIHDRIAKRLSEETLRFREMKAILGFTDEDSTSLRYTSVLWPGFEFNARAGINGLLESANYSHRQRVPLHVDSPTELPAWSVDVAEFGERFGPATRWEQRPFFDDVLPAYAEYEFVWKGDRYGAGFLWGLFLSSSAVWE